METSYFKDRDGWNAKTTVQLDDKRQLAIRTSRMSQSGFLATRVTGWTRNDSGTMTHVMSFGIAGGDFSAVLERTPQPRITEKVVRQQHDRLIAQIDSIVAMAQAHYGKEIAVEAA